MFCWVKNGDAIKVQNILSAVYTTNLEIDCIVAEKGGSILDSNILICDAI
jgi:hypothetical protein